MAEILNQELNGVLADFADVQVQKRLPSYIEIFLSELPINAIFLFKSSNMQLQQSELGSLYVDSVGNTDTFPELDITGSPLPFTKYSVNMDDTELRLKKCWLDNEEKHLPVSLKSARNIISRYLLKEQNGNVPLWVVCDGSDKSRTLLLCGFKEEGWCSRSSVQYKGFFPLTCVDNEIDDLNSLSSMNKQCVSVQCVFDLNDDNSFEKTFEFTQNEVVPQNCIKMLIKLQWDCASLKVPLDGVSSVLAVDLNVGHKSSAIFSLWKQLNLLSKYYEMLWSTIHDKRSTILSSNCSSDEILHEKLSKKILALINSPEDTFGSLSQGPCGSDLANEKFKENLLTVLIKQVVGCMRPDCDITDRIWLLLNEFNDVKNITACLNCVFSELDEGKSKIQASLRKKTVLSNIISAILNGNLAVNEISVEKTLEVMVESGIEKLKHDYDYIFKKLGVNCSTYLKKIPMSFAKSLDVIEYNINVLGQMHVALDFILGVQFYFDMGEQHLNAFALAVFKKSCEIISSLEILQNNTQVSLEVPVIFECVVDHLPSYYSNLKLVTSSVNEEIRDYSVLLLSSKPIFPPALMQFDGEKEAADATCMEQQYHVYKMSCLCDYVGKQLI